jgi:hypothetical protein
VELYMAHCCLVMVARRHVIFDHVEVLAVPWSFLEGWGHALMYLPSLFQNTFGSCFCFDASFLHDVYVSS